MGVFKKESRPGVEARYKDFNYVVTNPDGDTTKLEATDLVFVLAKHDPGDPDLWDEYKDN